MATNGAAEVRTVESPVEKAIKTGISEYKTDKERIKEKRKELEDALMQDHEYSNAKKLIQETNKQKKDRKEQIILKDRDLQDLDTEIERIGESMKGTQISIFDNLLEYNKATGRKEIVDYAGETHMIEISAKTEL